LLVGFTSLALGAGSAAAAPEYTEQTVPDALARADEAIERIIAIPAADRTFENTIGAMDDVIARLDLDTNMFTFMAYVSPDPQLREIAEAGDEIMRDWYIDLSQREDLYEAVKEYADTNPQLEGERARLLEETLRDYRRAGMDLPKEQRDKLAEVKKEISKLGLEFDRNIREYEMHVPLTEEELVGTSEDFRKSLTKSGDMFLVGMSYPEFLPIDDFCEDETTRRKMWLAYKRRGGKKNIGVLERLIAKRAEAAEILGYDSPAAYEVEVRMSKVPSNVEDFYKKLRPLVRRKAEMDYAQFVAAKREHTGNPDAQLYPWDYSFYKNRLLESEYAVDAEKVQEYFPLHRVTEGLFTITQDLYGLEYEEITQQAAKDGILWHEDVKMYAVRDKKTGERIGEFFIDLHPRPNKYGHAAHWGVSQNKVWMDGSHTKPQSALVCNFTKPTEDKPSLLTHDEVETYFHEFGHLLHNLMSRAEMWSFSGARVERDFVEAPSQMFENWIWDADVLSTFAGHYETGEPLPRELLDGMIAARNLGSGMAAERQFFYGLYDMTLHTDPEGDLDTTELGHEMWGELGSGVELYAAVPETYFQSAFGHLTGYQAGYYGYQWS
ncbi:MAG: M3 family metallopeptidase, partial [Synechococcaceae cyanobacterium]|nr:M3 family metallopeptidase [Synechococcaceae cyanobacterium]